MQEQKFVYKGKELIVPLEFLIIKLKEEEKKAKDSVTEFGKSNPSRNLMGMDPLTQRSLELEAKHRNALFDLTKAVNWLREAKRTPRYKWILDFGDLQWLYR